MTVDGAEDGVRPPITPVRGSALARWRQRLRRLLIWRRARAFALVLLALYVVAWVNVVILNGDAPLNSGGVPIAGDFIAFQAAGRLVLSGQAADLYSHDALVTVQDQLLGGRIPHFYDAFRNPPFVALLYAPFASLDLLQAFAAWCAIGVACLALALWLLLQETPGLQPRWRGLLIFVLAFPPVYFGFIDGENALLSLLLFALIYRSFVRNQEYQRGMWAALGLFKPQLFFVFPFVLLITRRWRALLAYVLTALALAAISLALVGPEGMRSWLRILLVPEGGNATVNGWRMASAKSFFDALLPGFGTVSIALYALTTVVLLALLARVWTRREVNLLVAWALTCLVAVLVDPHLVDYDLTVLVSAAMIAAPLVPKLLWAIVPLYLVTLLRASIPLSDTVSLQLTPLLLAACAVWIYPHAVRAPAIYAWITPISERVHRPISPRATSHKRT